MLDNLMDLIINLLGYLLTVVPLFSNFTAKKDWFLLAPEGPRAQFITHSIIGNHLTGNYRSALNIVVSTGGHFIED